MVQGAGGCGREWGKHIGEEPGSMGNGGWLQSRCDRVRDLGWKTVYLF